MTQFVLALVHRNTACTLIQLHQILHVLPRTDHKQKVLSSHPIPSRLITPKTPTFLVPTLVDHKIQPRPATPPHINTSAVQVPGTSSPRPDSPETPQLSPASAPYPSIAPQARKAPAASSPSAPSDRHRTRVKRSARGSTSALQAQKRRRLYAHSRREHIPRYPPAQDQDYDANPRPCPRWAHPRRCRR